MENLKVRPKMGGEKKTGLRVNNTISLANTYPADYSFRKIKSLDKVEGARPRTMRVGKEVGRGPTGKLVSNSLWLNNNSLESIQYITEFVNDIFEAPNRIEWLDFSFNSLFEVDEEIQNFRELKILYLHGNCISKINTISRLRPLKNLKKLTLHGCPVETIPFYRQHVISLLPQLKSLDYGTVTPKEANAPPPPGFSLEGSDD